MCFCFQPTSCCQIGSLSDRFWFCGFDGKRETEPKSVVSDNYCCWLYSGCTNFLIGFNSFNHLVFYFLCLTLAFYLMSETQRNSSVCCDGSGPVRGPNPLMLWLGKWPLNPAGPDLVTSTVLIVSMTTVVCAEGGADTRNLNPAPLSIGWSGSRSRYWSAGDYQDH